MGNKRTARSAFAAFRGLRSVSREIKVIAHESFAALNVGAIHGIGSRHQQRPAYYERAITVEKANQRAHLNTANALYNIAVTQNPYSDDTPKAEQRFRAGAQTAPGVRRTATARRRSNRAWPSSSDSRSRFEAAREISQRGVQRDASALPSRAAETEHQFSADYSKLRSEHEQVSRHATKAFEPAEALARQLKDLAVALGREKSIWAIFCAHRAMASGRVPAILYDQAVQASREGGQSIADDPAQNCRPGDDDWESRSSGLEETDWQTWRSKPTGGGWNQTGGRVHAMEKRRVAGGVEGVREGASRARSCARGERAHGAARWASTKPLLAVTGLDPVQAPSPAGARLTV